MIKIVKIGETNWFQCTQLKVTESQKEIFTVPVVYWMAKCRYQDNHFEKAIYNNDDLIGFAVWAFDEENKEYWIAAIMIDEKYQNKGYGKIIMDEIIELFRDKKVHKIHLFIQKTNKQVIDFYNKLAWEIRDDIIMMSYVPNKDLYKRSI